MMAKMSNIVDVYVGARLRMWRTMFNDEPIGELLGVTFQQVQKYEKGSNRISASRLQHTARVLGASRLLLRRRSVKFGRTGLC